MKSLHKITPTLYTLFCFTSLLISLALLIGLISYITVKGFSSFSFPFLLTPFKASSASGGILYQFLGTLILGITLVIFISPLAYGFSLLHSFYLKEGWVKRSLSLFIYSLNGIPSILFGLFGFFLFVKYFGWGKSWLAGGIILAFVSLPTVAIAIMERINNIPKPHTDVAYSLGLNQDQIAKAVIIPQSLNGYGTGLLLGLSRGIGETAPILFTATVFAGATLPSGVQNNPVLSLPYHIFVLAQDSFRPEALSQAWGTAFVLILCIFLLNLLALPIRLKIHEKVHHE